MILFFCYDKIKLEKFNFGIVHYYDINFMNYKSAFVINHSEAINTTKNWFEEVENVRADDRIVRADDQRIRLKWWWSWKSPYHYRYWIWNISYWYRYSIHKYNFMRDDYRTFTILNRHIWASIQNLYKVAIFATTRI